MEFEESEPLAAIESEFGTSEFDAPPAYRQRGRVDRRSDGTIAPPIKRSMDAAIESGFLDQEAPMLSSEYSSEISQPQYESQMEMEILSEVNQGVEVNDAVDENGAPRRRRRRSSAT